MNTFSYDIIAFEALIGIYFSYSVVMFAVSHTIRFLRNRT
jgi:hypothetical protein